MSKWKWATIENLSQDVGKRIVVANYDRIPIAVGTLEKRTFYLVDRWHVRADDIYAVFGDIFEMPADALPVYRMVVKDRQSTTDLPNPQIN